MKRLVAITALVSGMLLILVPRYILPACEYEGYPRMHCSDTAAAEYILGAALMVVGCATFFAHTDKRVLFGAVVSCILAVIAYRLPDTFGYCQSPRMPCNYGMVPGIRFIAVIEAMIMIIAIVNLFRKSRRNAHP